MNYPTGMHAGTGMHYNNVAARMQAYLRSPRLERRSPSPFPAAQIFQHYPQRMGFNPMVANEIGAMARGVMRNILS